MVIKVAILDDEQKDLNKVHNYFKSISSNNIQYNCDEYQHINESFFNYDLYVLDIELPSINGFEAAQMIKEKNPQAILIIHSKRNDLVFESFKFGVFFFIRKDHFEIDMEYCILRLNEHFINNKKEYISNNQVIPYQDILYIEKVNHNIEIHLKDGQILKEKKSIKQIQNEIISNNIIQCHQSYLVNLTHVRKLDENDFVINKERIQISRRYIPSARKAYIEYLGKKVQI